MSLLITGGAGFIGSHLVARVLKDYSVVCVDSFNDYYNPRWKEDNVRTFLNKPNFSLHRIDITDESALRAVFKSHEIDGIVHLAARAGVRPSIDQPRLYQEVNVGGSLNVLELAREFGVKQVVLGSTSSVYGNQQKVPFSETDPVDHPISPYSATKKAMELLGHTYSYLHGMNITCLRFFTVYGPGGRPDMAPYLFTEAILHGKSIKKFGDGSSRRDYTFVEDIVDGIVKAIENPFRYEIINLGNNTPVTLNQFIETLETITGKSMVFDRYPIQPGDVDQTFADISKAKSLLGWEPKTSFEDGLREFVSWYKKVRG